MKNTAIKRKIYCALIVTVFILISIATVFILSPKVGISYADSYDEVTPFTGTKATLDDDFEDNKVIVTLKHDYSEVNKAIDEQMFFTSRISSLNYVENGQNNSSADIFIKSVQDA